MPPQELAYRLQKALLWEKEGINSYGEPIIAATPIELDVRWGTGKNRTVTGPNGEPIAIDGTIIVDRRITIGSIMWLGSLSQWYGTGSAETSVVEPRPELMQTITYDDTPDIKNRAHYREVGVMYFRGTLPSHT